MFSSLDMTRREFLATVGAAAGVGTFLGAVAYLIQNTPKSKVEVAEGFYEFIKKVEASPPSKRGKFISEHVEILSHLYEIDKKLHLLDGIRKYENLAWQLSQTEGIDFERISHIIWKTYDVIKGRSEGTYEGVCTGLFLKYCVGKYHGKVLLPLTSYEDLIKRYGSSKLLESLSKVPRETIPDSLLAVSAIQLLYDMEVYLIDATKEGLTSVGIDAPGYIRRLKDYILSLPRRLDDKKRIRELYDIFQDLRRDFERVFSYRYIRAKTRSGNLQIIVKYANPCWGCGCEMKLDRTERRKNYVDQNLLISFDYQSRTNELEENYVVDHLPPKHPFGIFWILFPYSIIPAIPAILYGIKKFLDGENTNQGEEGPLDTYTSLFAILFGFDGFPFVPDEEGYKRFEKLIEARNGILETVERIEGVENPSKDYLAYLMNAFISQVKNKETGPKTIVVPYSAKLLSRPGSGRSFEALMRVVDSPELLEDLENLTEKIIKAS